MSSTALYRISGLALVLCGPLAVAGRLLHPPDHSLVYQTSPIWPLAHLLLLLSFGLTLLGLPGLYGRLAGQMGVVGLVAYGLTFVATLGALLNQFHEAQVAPILAANSATQTLSSQGGVLQYAPFGAFEPVRGPLTVIGLLLFGGLLARTVFAGRWGGALVALGALVYLASPLGEVVFHIAGAMIALGWAWAGYGLVTEQVVRFPGAASRRAPSL